MDNKLETIINKLTVNQIKSCVIDRINELDNKTKKMISAIEKTKTNGRNDESGKFAAGELIKALAELGINTNPYEEAISYVEKGLEWREELNQKTSYLNNY